MALDLVIVHPGAQYGIYGALGDHLTALEPPTWARMIAGYLLDRGYEVAIVDAEALRLSPDQVATFVADQRPRLVAIVVSGHQPSASTQQMVGASAIALAIKRANPSQVVVMTGNHPSALPERTMREEAVDYVIDGEGPRTLEALLEGFSNVRWRGMMPGLVWRSQPSGRIVHNPLAPLIEDLDGDLHGRAWGKLPMGQYRAHNWQMFGRDPAERTPYASLYTSLGCPYRCSFCVINTIFHANRYRTFSPREVVNQMEMLRAVYGVRTFKLADELFVLNPIHYIGVCDEIVNRGLNRDDDLNIWAYSRVDTIREGNLGRLRAAGVRWLALGIEAADGDVRDGAEKNLRRDDIVDVVRSIQGVGINVIANYMMGLRDDDAASMQRTLDLAIECRSDFANFYSVMAYPGTKLYDQAVEEGWALPETWRGYSQHNDDCRPLDTKHVDAATVLRFRDRAFQEFFSDRTYRGHVLEKFGPSALEDIDLMLSYNLTRKLLQ